MSQRINELGQPIGEALPQWIAAQVPNVARMVGTYCDVERVDSRKHAADLLEAYRQDSEGRLWTYLTYGPFETVEEISQWLDAAATNENQIFYAIVEKRTGKALGIATYLRIQPDNGVIEVGGISYAPKLQRTPMATEAMFLMMKHVFDVFGYRRYEWKCDALNEISCRAAERLGFTYEGLFRQAVIYRGRNRDTAWYAIIDKEWPAIKNAFEAWLAPGNFDSEGHQKRKLGDLMVEKRNQVQS